ncbi:MAG: sulfatase-like hydrolase/transferase, partial [Chloroflexi bacterium]|nr:sulfatase-like hydrolase/transferase [Chloroflexota bacterium]
GLSGDACLPEWGFTEGIDNEGKMDAVRSGALEPKGPYMAHLHARGLAQLHVDDFRGRKGYAATHPTPLPDDAYCDNWIAENGLRLLERFPAGRPWHLVVNFTGPHNPMDVTESMQRRWEGIELPPPETNDQLDAATHRRIRQNYAAMLENIDDHIGRYLELVEVRGELDRTVIVYSSDHGEMLGEHNRWAKSTYYQPSVGVPLIVAGPGVRAGVVSAALVLLHDLTATFLELAGLEPLPEMDSRSLVPVLSGRAESHRECVTSALDRWRMVFDGRYKLVEHQQDGALLFDHQTDAGERHNIAAEAQDDVRRLKRR